MRLTPIIDPTNVSEAFLPRRLRQMQPKQPELFITIHGAAGPQRFRTCLVEFCGEQHRRVSDDRSRRIVGHYSPDLRPREACEIAYWDLHSVEPGMEN